MDNQKRGSLIRGIVFLLIIIIVGAYLVFGDIPDYIYWTFIVSINITYHTMEYIIRLRRSRDMYKTSCEVFMDITAEMMNNTTELAKDIEAIMSPKTLQFLDKFADKFSDARDLI